MCWEHGGERLGPATLGWIANTTLNDAFWKWTRLDSSLQGKSWRSSECIENHEDHTVPIKHDDYVSIGKNSTPFQIYPKNWIIAQELHLGCSVRRASLLSKRASGKQQVLCKQQRRSRKAFHLKLLLSLTATFDGHLMKSVPFSEEQTATKQLRNSSCTAECAEHHRWMWRCILAALQVQRFFHAILVFFLVTLRHFERSCRFNLCMFAVLYFDFDS